MTSTETSPGKGSRARIVFGIALAAWVIALLVILAHVWTKPGSNTLYKVFKAGGVRWLAAKNLYPKVDEYIYSPAAAAFFAPFALLPDRVAGILWRLLSVSVYTAAFSAWCRKWAAQERVAFAWILMLPLSVGDIFNGQANPLVIGLLMWAVLACRFRWWMAAALCIGAAAYLKVYPLAIGLLLGVLYPGKFPLRLAAALVGIFGISLLLQKPGYVWEQYGNWLQTLGKDPRRTLHYYGTYRDFWLLLRVLRVPISIFGWTVLQALSGAALALYLWLARRRGMIEEKLDFLLLTLGACWMLLFGPATESSTYVMLAPPLALAWLRWSAEEHGRRYIPGAIGCYVLLIGSQMLTSWAHQHQNAFTHLIQPTGAMILAVTLLGYGWRGETKLVVPPTNV